MAENILELKNLVFSFRTYGGEVKAVRDVSFNVRKGEILGIVGEYLGKLMLNINKTPQYVVRETANISQKEETDD